MSLESDAITLLDIIQKISDKSNSPDTMIIGEIIKLDPLQIDIGHNMIIYDEQIFLGQMCRPHKVKIPHTHQYNGNTELAETGITATTTATVSASSTPGVVTIIDLKHQHDIKEQVTEDVHKEGTDYEESVTLEIEPKLKVGDKVLIFAFNNYQTFYVAERIEGE